ncbi:MAG: hypothetical protein ACFFHD_02310, partial [Promethearchaeota archaeon]
IRPDKIGIDLVLCPKTNLYLQDLFCRRCAYYESDNENFVECGFTGHRYGKSDPIKDKLIKDLSNKFITELPIDDKKRSEISFAEHLKAATPKKSDKELLKRELSDYMKARNLATTSDKNKKKASKESDSTK